MSQCGWPQRRFRMCVCLCACLRVRAFACLRKCVPVRACACAVRARASGRFTMQELLHLAAAEPGNNIVDCTYMDVDFTVPPTKLRT